MTNSTCILYLSVSRNIQNFKNVLIYLEQWRQKVNSMPIIRFMIGYLKRKLTLVHWLMYVSSKQSIEAVKAKRGLYPARSAPITH